MSTSLALQDRFEIRGDRRCGIDRFSLVGTLDRSSVLVLESALRALDRVTGALILDLHLLMSIDGWGVHVLERAARRASLSGLRLAIVNAPEQVRDAFEEAGVTALLSGGDVSDLLEEGDVMWSPISLPSFLGQRTKTRGGTG